MRPKHVLWLAAAIVWSVWYAIDPQAQPPSAEAQKSDASLDRSVAGAPVPGRSTDHRIAQDR